MTNYIYKALIGQILGDGHLKRLKSGKAALAITGGTLRESYINWLGKFFWELKPKISHFIVTAIANGRLYNAWRMTTPSTLILGTVHSMFYVEKNGKFVKVVPSNIGELMCSIVLAHLLMGDGSFHPNGYIAIYTNCFTHEDCVRLADSIKNNLGIDCRVIPERVSKKTGIQQYRIVIPKSQVPLLQELLAPHMCPDIMYRIGK